MSSTHYQLPDSTDSAVNKMLIALGIVFVVLILIAALVFYHAKTIAQMIPFSAEQRFVRPYEQLLSHIYTDKSKDSTVEDYLQQLSNELQTTMEIADDIEFQLHYLDIEMLNAFATLGGHVFITQGLIRAMPDENSLAMVLAHEMAHVVHRDPISSMGRGLALQMIIGFITGGHGNAKDALDLLGGGGVAHFSREQEQHADLAALHALNAYYGHVGGYRTFFEKAHELEMLDKEDNTTKNDDYSEVIPGSWLASHPDTAERLQYLDQEQLLIGAHVGENIPLPTNITEAIRIGISL